MQREGLGLVSCWDLVQSQVLIQTALGLEAKFPASTCRKIFLCFFGDFVDKLAESLAENMSGNKRKDEGDDEVATKKAKTDDGAKNGGATGDEIDVSKFVSEQKIVLTSFTCSVMHEQGNFPGFFV